MKRFYMVLVFLMVILTACGAGAALEPAADAASGAGCAPAPGEATLLQEETLGYCLHYPAGYEARTLGENVMEIAPAGAEASLIAEGSQMTVKVSPADGRSAEEIADDFYNQIADDVVAEFGVERETAVVDGVTAQVIDNVPEQNASRYLFLVQDDRLYTLTFLPADAEGMDSFYQEVLDSFRFTE
jgi:hypothetical protein